MKYQLIAETASKKVHSCKVYTFDLIEREFRWENTNKLINKTFMGSKTGITPSSGPCLVNNFKYGDYESQCCIIDSKTQEIRWKEMATLQLWAFDKYLRKNQIGGYNRQVISEYRKMKQLKIQEEQEEQKIKEEQKQSEQQTNGNE